MYYFEVPCASDEDQLEATPVKCITSDNQEIFVEIGILRVSKMLNDLLGVRPDPEEVEIPLSEVKAQTFNIVIEWCKNHKGKHIQSTLANKGTAKPATKIFHRNQS